MDELDQLLIELESMTQTLTSSTGGPTTSSPSPVSLGENVAAGFASAMTDAIKTPPSQTATQADDHTGPSGSSVSAAGHASKLPRSESLTFKVEAAVGVTNHTDRAPPLPTAEPVPQDRRPSHAALPAASVSTSYIHVSPDPPSQPQPPSPAWIKSPSSTSSLAQPAPPPPPPTSDPTSRPRAISVTSTASASTHLPNSSSTLATPHPTDPDRTCASCHQPINGAYVQALGQDWHLDHLSCTICAKVLTATTFYEHQGALYCQTHHSDLVAPRCAYCSTAITDRCVTALGQQWHPDHFFCSQCGKPLAGVGFMEHQGKAYCDEDYFALFAPPCGACGKPVMADCVAALQQSWHPSCFVCAECKGAFAGGTFFAHEGKPYCEMHYHMKRGSLCPGCNRPIVGKCVNAMGKKWHLEHFACGYCQKNLNKMPFKEKEGKAFCVPCHTRLYG